jgi:hypothetical protein
MWPIQLAFPLCYALNIIRAMLLRLLRWVGYDSHMQKVRNVSYFLPKPRNERCHWINSGTLRRIILNRVLKK